MRTHPLLLALTLLLWPSPQARAAEETFKDPLTGKSGKYTIAFPKDGGGSSLGLLVYFHGSGGGPGYAGGFEGLARLAAAHKLVPLAIQAPGGAEHWPDDPRGAPTRHVDYAKSLLDKVVFTGSRAPDRKRTVFVGFSSGSTFLHGDFLPRHGESFEGGAVLLCGGSPPLVQTPEISGKVSDGFKRRFRLYHFIQKGDYLYKQTMDGAEYWRQRGATVEVDAPAGGAHCGFDLMKEMGRGVKAVLGVKS